jgi:hypothetical protein
MAPEEAGPTHGSSVRLDDGLIYRDGNIHRLNPAQQGDSASSGNIIRKATAEEIAKYGSAGRGEGGGTRFVDAADFTKDQEDSTNSLPGKEFRTEEQRRAEAELAAQLGVDKLSEVKPPTKPDAVKMEEENISPVKNQFLDTKDKLLSKETPLATVTKAGKAIDVDTPTVLEGPEGTATTVAGQEKEMTAATKAAPTRIIDPDDIEGTVSAESLAEAQTEELDQRATVSFQLEQLFEGKGNFTNLFAKPIREATDRMLARGLGSSSMAAAAIIQSTIESGIPIAREDANKFATIQIQNLTHKQQTALANASVFAAMDQTNVGVRLQSQIQNAQNFLTIDTANLTNLQQEEVLNQQARNQFLLSDQAAENAMEQLNVQTQAQHDRFFAELGIQVQENNANRTTSVEQFNAGQANTISVFNAKQKDLRERFNSEMQAQIQASNAQWRRQLTTINNANQMAVNEFNAREINNMNIRDYNNVYQTYRDTAARIYQSSENNETRAVSLASAELAASAAMAGGGSSGKSGLLSSIIGAAGTVIGAMIMSPCHVAQEVYGVETNEWIKFRYWMYHQSPKWFKNAYMKHSLPVSKFIHNKPRVKSFLKYFMDKQVRKVVWNA